MVVMLLFIGMEKNSDDSKQQCFSSNTNDGKSSGVKLGLEMLKNDIRGFPSVNKRSTRTKNLMLKWRKDLMLKWRKLRTRDSTQKNDSFAINLFPTDSHTKIGRESGYVRL